MRFSVDTNVLMYTFENSDRGEIANRFMRAAVTADCVLSNQVLGEFNNAVRRHYRARMAEARRVVSEWSLLFPIAPTATWQLIEANELSERHLLQYWDSVILIVARDAGAEWLVTEDMQDGATIDGVRIINPFDPANAALLDLLLTVQITQGP